MQTFVTSLTWSQSWLSMHHCSWILKCQCENLRLPAQKRCLKVKAVPVGGVVASPLLLICLTVLFLDAHQSLELPSTICLGILSWNRKNKSPSTFISLVFSIYTQHLCRPSNAVGVRICCERFSKECFVDFCQAVNGICQKVDSEAWCNVMHFSRVPNRAKAPKCLFYWPKFLKKQKMFSEQLTAWRCVAFSEC